MCPLHLPLSFLLHFLLLLLTAATGWRVADAGPAFQREIVARLVIPAVAVVRLVLLNKENEINEI